MMMRKAPSLVDLCVQLAIDNIRYLGDVGCIDYHLLDRILSHCTVDNLAHIEDRTEGRDLTTVTDKYWMKFYKKDFGVEHTEEIIERMRKRNVTFPWRKLYQKKLEEREERTKKAGDRVSQRYKELEAKKQSRQIKVVSKVPPSSKKRSYWGGPGDSNICSTKSRLLKKAKIEYINSPEVKNAVAMKKMTVQRTHSASPSKGKAIVASGFASSSSNKLVQRRF